MRTSLYNPRLKRRYDIQDDIPVMLVDEAETVADDEDARLLAKAAAEEHHTDIRGVTVALPDVIDTLDMFGPSRACRSRSRQAASFADAVPGPLPHHDDIEHVVVLGMGGSGIAGDVVREVAGPFMPVPVVVHKGYGMPNFISDNTLVFAVSFSGNTEETLEAVGRGRGRRRRTS